MPRLVALLEQLLAASLDSAGFAPALLLAHELGLHRLQAACVRTFLPHFMQPPGEREKAHLLKVLQRQRSA